MNFKSFFVFFFGLIGLLSWGQPFDGEQPVLWKASLSELEGEKFQVKIEGTLAEGWHLFSQFTPEGGSLPTELEFENAEENYQLIGKTKEGETKTEFSEIFEVNEVFFKKQAIFTQEIKRINPEFSELKVNIYYQVCKDVCIPGEEYFSLQFSEKQETQASQNTHTNPSPKEETPKITESPPPAKTDSAILSGIQAVIPKQTTVEQKESTSPVDRLKLPLKNKELLASETKASDSLWQIFVLGFIGGLLALLTPCVFPIIPLTVSYFTKQSASRAKGIRNALFYGGSIILIYLLISLPFHFLDSIDPEILNNISSNIGLNLFFFVILVLFAFSFFGFYDLSLPNSWLNKVESSSGIGSILGIFLMALTLAIVSFSCTGPILGSLLAGSLNSERGAIQLSAGFFGFGAALALPFTLFAIFPSGLKSLPKSGGWLSTLKITLGFIELGLALKFLSNADLVGNWGILKKETFLTIWIVILTAMALYFLDVYRFPKEPKSKISNWRILIIMLIFGAIGYLGKGFQKESRLHFLSGFIPPAFYSIYAQESECPLGLDCFKDFEEGLTYAKQQNKPILLDFTGFTCSNCRRMEDNVWVKPNIYDLIKNDFVLISLYVDDRKALPKENQFEYPLGGKIKRIKTVGNLWSTFQYINFNISSQPYYVLLSPDLEVLAEAQQYSPPKTFYNWLKKGLIEFKRGDVAFKSNLD